MPAPQELMAILAPHTQSHLIEDWDELSQEQRSHLESQIQAIDFDVISQLFHEKKNSTSAHDDDIAARAKPPSVFVGQPFTEDKVAGAKQTGEELIAAGKVGAILVAGGQGTRLGFDHPKGMYPIGPVSGAMLFSFLCGQIVNRSKKAGATIPYYIMTSDATHEETVDCFEKENYFGLNPDDVFFFKQGTMPAVDMHTGHVLLAEKGKIATSPDGHGGLLNGLDKSGALADMQSRGIEVLHYHQVDNPTAIVCDPIFLGLHQQHNSQVSTKVLAKVNAAEKMGVVCEVDGKTQIVEYSDIPDDIAAKTDEDGELLLKWGNTAIHVFSRSFIETLCKEGTGLPFHIANKKLPHLDQTGQVIKPETPNAFKFEKFIFDALPLAKTALVVETSRAREFNPVKNAEGNDSPATAKAALSALFKSWLEEAGAEIADDAVVEIDPAFAVSAEELKGKVEGSYSGEVLLK
ncbi:UTP--glucose-1-phosphate uridylyltransferase [Calycomorphotria hydatis]|uniref:Putative uridylyltransferase n=1 Tax=Calycomorphotria hydatis TaxID=2528027 RepID=A0A517T3U0_9PLAN|nr:UDPGP type 1 family protein [Calycomorphotria hydatis]QDT63038.1 putative uridylyltransferase [Calycomorphotria hydatis]